MYSINTVMMMMLRYTSRSKWYNEGEWKNTSGRRGLLDFYLSTYIRSIREMENQRPKCVTWQYSLLLCLLFYTFLIFSLALNLRSIPAIEPYRPSLYCNNQICKSSPFSSIFNTFSWAISNKSSNLLASFGHLSDSLPNLFCKSCQSLSRYKIFNAMIGSFCW